MSIQRFTLFYLVYCAFIALLACVIPVLFPGTVILVGKFWLVYGFFAGVTFIAYVLVDLGLKRNPEAGVMAIMGSIALKMVFSMAFVLIYSLKANEKGIVFVLNFFSLYLLFSFFEIYALLCNLRHQNK